MLARKKFGKLKEKDSKEIAVDINKNVLENAAASLPKDPQKDTLEIPITSTLDRLSDDKSLDKKIMSDTYIAAENNNKSSTPPYRRDLPTAQVDGVLGFDVAYARLQAIQNNEILTIAAIEPLAQQLLNTRTVTGGFGWRLYANGVMNVSSVVGIGGEIAFSYYPHSSFSQRLNININNTGLIGFANIKTHGYGVDFLADFRFHCLSNFFISFKPGIQLAYQRNKISGNLDLSSIVDGFSELGGNNRYQICQFLPQIVLAADWNFIEGLMGRWGISAHMTYQHVWGQDNASLQNLISSRDMVGGGFAIRF